MFVGCFFFCAWTTKPFIVCISQRQANVWRLVLGAYTANRNLSYSPFIVILSLFNLISRPYVVHASVFFFFIPFRSFFSSHTKLFAIQSTFCFFPNHIICVCHYSVALILLLFGHNFSFSLTTSVLFIILLRFMARNIHTHHTTHTAHRERQTQSKQIKQSALTQKRNTNKYFYV